MLQDDSGDTGRGGDEAAPDASAERVSTHTQTLRVDDLSRLNGSVLQVTLRDPDGSPLPPWRPGAHVTVHLPDGLERQYSLCGDVDDASRWTIAVLREPQSRGGSAYVHADLRVGDRLPVTGPANHFPLLPADRYLFIAGGIGITPILPMIRSVAAAGEDWRLVYGGRRRDSMAFVDKLSDFGDHVAILPESEFGLLDVAAEIAGSDSATHTYACGPESLIKVVEAIHPATRPGQLHVERFRPRDQQPTSSTSFEIHLDYSDLTLTVGPDQTIVDVVREAGVDVATSCGEGTCGTCETTVLEGVPDHRDSVLTDEERAANDVMMVCCSRSRSPRLVLDL